MSAFSLYIVVLLIGYKVSSRYRARLKGINISRADIKHNYIMLGAIYGLGILYID